MDGYNRIKEWESKTGEVLDDILKSIENRKSLGYFDSLIDVETNSNLIIMARNKYIDMHNQMGGYPKNPDLIVSEEDVRKQFKGGYSIKEQERLIKLLTGKY